MQYDFRPIVQGSGNADPYGLQALLQQAGLWDGFTNMPANMGDRPRGQQYTTDWDRLNGYQLGSFEGNGREYYALRDPQGNIVATHDKENGAITLRDLVTGAAFIGGASYAIPALAGAAGAGGAAAAGGAGGAGGGNALLSGGAAGGGTVAGSGLTAGANALYAPSGFAGGTGSALAGTSLGGAGAAAGGAAALGGAGTGAGAMSTGWLGLSPNTWANLGQTAIGLIGQNQGINAMQDATAESNALARYVYDTNRADNMPLVNLRNSVLPQIQSLLSNPSSITSDPGYQFQFNEGMRARQNSAAGAGMTYSGAQQKALTRYGTDYASTKLNDSLNRLTSVAGLGQVGSNNNQQAANQYGNTVGGNALNMGNARGSAYIGGANLAGNALGNWYNNRQYNQMWGLED